MILGLDQMRIFRILAIPNPDLDPLKSGIMTPLIPFARDKIGALRILWIPMGFRLVERSPQMESVNQLCESANGWTRATWFNYNVLQSWKCRGKIQHQSLIRFTSMTTSHVATPVEI